MGTSKLKVQSGVIDTKVTYYIILSGLKLM
jgi:hypothetical protein